jgi:toxin ParE1/3/4
MAVYSLSSKAAADLDGIYEYTILNFGLEQARMYLQGLHERFATLAEHPDAWA